MSYSQALDNVVDLIEAAAPQYQKLVKFRCKDRPSPRGDSEPSSAHRTNRTLEDLTGYDNASRLFELYSEGVSEPLDIITGGEVGYYRTSMELRIAYSVQSRMEFDKMAVSDTPVLTDALLHISDWGSSLENIEFFGGFHTEQLTDEDDAIKGYIVSYTFDMDWAHHEC